MATLFSGGRIFVGDGRVLEKGSVLVHGERIIEVSEGEILPHEEAEHISLEGCTLLPGFIDCHVHLCMDASLDTFGALAEKPDAQVALMAAEFAKRTLNAGITGIRDLGGKNGVDLVIRDAIASGIISGPRMQAAGRMICMTGGTGWLLGREADGPHEVRKAVREQIKSGADVIKIMATGGILTPGVEPASTQYDKAELQAGIEEAHKAGRRAASHAQGTDGIKNAIRAGIDTIEHGFYMDEEAVSEMFKKGVALVPTLSIYTAGARAIEECHPKEIVDEVLNRSRPDHYRSVKMAREAGVKVAMGTDAGTAFNIHGRNLVELKHLVEVGYSNEEAVMAGTHTSAQVLGWDQDVGTIEAGKLADLVAVSGNPMENIEILLEERNILLVMKGGDIFKKEL